MGVDSRKLQAKIAAGERILLDTSTLVAYLGGTESVSPVATVIIDDYVRAGRNPGVVSMVTVMELLVRPLQKSPREFVHVRDFLRQFPNLRAVPVDIDVAIEAATLRANHGFKPPDALIIGSGLVHQVASIASNDGAWGAKLAPIAARVMVITLSDYLKP